VVKSDGAIFICLNCVKLLTHELILVARSNKVGDGYRQRSLSGTDVGSATMNSVFKFVPPIKGPEVSSDTAPMPRGVVWDAEGPFVWREAPGWKETHHPKFSEFLFILQFH
jgi:hypothetical protein